MSTVEKALKILDLFSESQPRLRAAEIARLLKRDKSTVQRYIAGLAARGILEQDPRDKYYYLGASLARLAVVRDRTHPVAEQVKVILQLLVEQTGETAHVCELIGRELMVTACVETKIRGTRVYVDPAVPLPFHATGSGIAFLSCSNVSHRQTVLASTLSRYTEHTVVNAQRVADLIDHARDAGYAKLSGTFASDVIGVAAPITAYNGVAKGAVAVATPVARFNPEQDELIVSSVIAASKKISRLYGAK